MIEQGIKLGEPNKDNFKNYKVVVPNASNISYAETISAWTLSAGTMLPKSKEEVLSFFGKCHSIVIVGENDTLISHAAATFIYSDGSIEIGAMYTKEEERGKGAQTKALLVLLSMLKVRYPGRTLFALGNEQSSPLFRKIGGIEIKPEELGKEVWEPCSTCPKNPKLIGKIKDSLTCCDTPFNLTNVKSI